MENRRPDWQVCVRLLFSLLATAAFIIVCWELIGFFMAFVFGWVFSVVLSSVCKLLGKKL